MLPITHSHDHSLAYGYAAGIVSAMCYGTNPLFAVGMYRHGLNVDSVLLYRYGFSLLLLGGTMFLRREHFRLSVRETATVAGMGLLFVLSSLFLYESYNYMDVGIASTLLFVYPLMVAALCALLYRERMSVATVTALAVCSAGVALLCRSGNGVRVSTTGVVLVLLSSLSYAIYIIGVKKSALRNFSALRLTFWVVAVGTLFLVVKIAAHGSFTPAHTLLDTACGLGLAVLPTVVSLVLMAIAVKRIGPTPTAILGSLEPVVGVLIGVAVWHEIITLRTACGMLLVLLSVVAVVARPHSREV